VTWENRLIFEVSSTDPDAAIPLWVDLTSRINDMLQPIEIGIGRQNDLEQSEPTNWTLILNNADDALTYGNTTSPYPWWGPGRKCRLREIVAGTVMPLATGYLQVPTETVSLSGIDQTVTVSIVDRLGRLQVSEPFASTLAAYIRSAGAGRGLVFYAPLNDSPTWADVIGGKLPGGIGGLVSGGFRVSLSSRQGAIALADDIASAAQYTGTALPGTIAELPYVVSLPLVPGQVATNVAWVRIGGDLISVAETPLQMIVNETGPSGNTFVNLQFVTPGTWGASSIFTMTGTINTSRVAVAGDVVPIALRYGYNPAVFEVWIGADRFVGSLSGSPPTSATVTRVYAGVNGFTGSISHVQLYIGDPTTGFTFADFAAQQNMGLTGLERQLTGDRVRTIAQYAGIPNAEFANTIDSGTSVMQVATLAGKTPLEAMREAETTEQGLLYVDGAGNLTFNDRRTLYNV